ncbi:hypothetical protein GT037_004258 [Alternaria burnsii]|uniref:Heterokaryon incompatibility domain-containing protein n=1 Tax=Alternaria burnsii TaxID=1187904 RepID=A0A8H7B960_9PLEO|nr:uncharacterized protein GT037_004258 [Alternaria burnsii]KAF7677399.1 hypothetical protein GT037_004258 [Alternaria burnsii]
MTRNLGFRYLWVDKYCVSQTDQSDFKHQIRQMHLIYRSAQITMIAGGSMDASSGLAGISTPRANMQTKGRYGSLSLITFTLHPWGPVKLNRGWVDRGWTLQESYFSQRRLIFTDKQVLFDCDRGIISEDLQHSQIDYLFPLGRGKPHVVEHDVHALIVDYTMRVLTYDDDILNAFDGILADLEQKEPPVRSHWGICSTLDASGLKSDEDTKLVVAQGLTIQVEKQSGLIEAWETFEEASLASTQRHHHSQRIHISAPSLEVRLVKSSTSVPYRGREIHGHDGKVVRSEEDGCWSESAYPDTSFESLELSPDTYASRETRMCHAIYLFSAGTMTDTDSSTVVHKLFAMLLVSKVGTNWERVGLWIQPFKSEEEAQVFRQWLQSSPTYKTRDFWIA